MSREGARSLLFYPKDTPSDAAQRHINEGELCGVHLAYKCASRTPWWRVPLVEIPDLFLTYMNHDRPRLIANEARAHSLNSVYGVALHHGRKTIGRALLPIACLNSLTLLGAEVVGRSYGGGLLKLEPKEADRLPVPSMSLLEAVQKELVMLTPELSKPLRSDDIARASEMIDDILLRRGLKMLKGDLTALREARELLLQRRVSRGRTMRGQN
jgi:hypothetical protein